MEVLNIYSSNGLIIGQYLFHDKKFVLIITLLLKNLNDKNIYFIKKFVKQARSIKLKI